MEKINKIMGKRGRITVPHELRVRLGLNTGDFVTFSLENGRVCLQKQGAPAAQNARAEALAKQLEALTLKEQFHFLALALGRQGGHDG